MTEVEAKKVRPGMIIVLAGKKSVVRSASVNGEKVYLMTDDWETHVVPAEGNVMVVSSGLSKGDK